MWNNKNASMRSVCMCVCVCHCLVSSVLRCHYSNAICIHMKTNIRSISHYRLRIDTEKERFSTQLCIFRFFVKYMRSYCVCEAELEGVIGTCINMGSCLDNTYAFFHQKKNRRFIVHSTYLLCWLLPLALLNSPSPLHQRNVSAGGRTTIIHHIVSNMWERKRNYQNDFFRFVRIRISVIQLPLAHTHFSRCLSIFVFFFAVGVCVLRHFPPCPKIENAKSTMMNACMHVVGPHNIFCARALLCSQCCPADDDHCIHQKIDKLSTDALLNVWAILLILIIRNLTYIVHTYMYVNIRRIQTKCEYVVRSMKRELYRHGWRKNGKR